MAVNNLLQPVSERGWRTGFANLMRKEISAWWGTKKWLKHVLIWSVLLNGLIALVSTGATSEGIAPAELLKIQTTVFFQFGGLATALGVIIATQDAVIGERQSGTMEWILSKPASRTAFIVSKLLAQAVSFTVIAVVLQSVLVYVQNIVWTGLQPNLVPFLGGLGLLILNVLFYLSLTIMLGCIFQARGPVTGTAIAFLFSGSILPKFFPELAKFFPWDLPLYAGAIGIGERMTSSFWPSIAATVAWIILFTGVALWRFNREEL